MSIYDDYTFIVEAVHPSGLLSYQSGHASSSRKFRLPCENAEEFVLRQLGKFYSPDITETPALPAPFPFDTNGESGYGQLNMVASAFSIEPISPSCFNVLWVKDSEDQTHIDNPVSFSHSEQYFYRTEPDLAEKPDDECCHCIATISYEENPCDCITFNEDGGEWEAHPFILPNTCISVERNPSYEMFTLPNGNLVWADLPEGYDRRLKQDSFAYKVIPKADIIVSWHNVPVNKLCQIESHLKEFRGTVNDAEWGEQLSCDDIGSDSGIPGCSFYEPETIMFIDFQEDRQFRTDAFGGMRTDGPASNRNTTTLKLIFKQKRIVVPANQSNSSSDDDTEEIVG